MSKKKQFPKDGIPRSRVRPRQSKKARDTYGKGFNVRGTPITCGYPLDSGGQCAAYVEAGDLCEIHWEQDREKRKTETLEDRREMIRRGMEQAERSYARVRREMEQKKAERSRKGRR